ncbi:YkgJ family cysteine cluster protein [uncultured Victivallis sp.]|uniref:YkgJ family cysteine cluster protein n=1 Tax=uncultured Victivallis sp. TaxID=354118 RepID=UPI0025E34200|nr:YkgJ family cysteine cluster protein [uncultured Victivallis sp.]
MKHFECIRCGNCCRWPGCVKVSDSEIDAIAAFLGLEVPAFIERYTALMPDRQGLTLIEKPDGSCVFLEEEAGVSRCRIHPVKPGQCGTFPRKWNFPGWEAECAGAKREKEREENL